MHRNKHTVCVSRSCYMFNGVLSCLYWRMDFEVYVSVSVFHDDYSLCYEWDTIFMGYSPWFEYNETVVML